jgi:homogentisate 1,2-dioxygenase
MQIQYQTGFGNYFQSESIANTLTPGRNSPQKVPHGLYAEQLSGSAFTAPRHLNLHSWLYRIRPSVIHGEFTLLPHAYLCSPPFNQIPTPPTQMRWAPLPTPQTSCDFIQGLFTLAGNKGAAIHLYSANTSMSNKFFYNSDGDFLIVPQQGGLRFKTELGVLDVKPGEIIVIPRGIKFQVLLLDNNARGYICENFGLPFRLPELGVIGANGLANARDFETPIACFEQVTDESKLITKFQGHLWIADISHSPLDVVAWHGNYAPYKYDLSKFNTINSVSFDHPDPSIFTVLTSSSEHAGTANIDFVIFPPRWMVAQDTFRPPYFHRNIMNEYMGLIHGTYDAKETGFIPGGGSLHNCMSAHGPDAEAFHKATQAALKPEFYDNTLAFMFESSNVWNLTPHALNAEFRQKDYLQCWQTLKSQFSHVPL